jgi:hypothetical protein
VPHRLPEVSGERGEVGFPVGVTPSRYVLLQLAHTITGYSVKAMERKIECGDWQGGSFGSAPRTVAS